MARNAALFFLLTALTAQCAVLKDKDAIHERVARSSCTLCNQEGPPSPPGPPPPPPPPPGFPPPPPLFRTQQWTGYTRSTDGKQLGVFSGSAAAAGGAQKASGQAVALASSSLDDSSEALTNGLSSQTQAVSGSLSQSNNEHIANSGSGSNGFSSNLQQTQSNGFGSNQHQTQGYGPVLTGSPSQSNNYEQQSQSLGGPVGARIGNGHYGSGQNFVGNTHSAQASGYASRGSGYNSQYLGGESGQQQFQQGGSFNQDSSIAGALGLAREGLKTANEAAQSASGCSTCGKSTYALSNAKSHSGSAVAISVGG